MNSAFFPGSDGIMERKLSIEIDWALAELYEYFAGQLNDKGWELEVQAIGDASAFGSWTRSPEPGVELRGMLTVIGTGDSRFDFELKILLPEGYR